MFQLNLLFLFFVGSATPSPFPNAYPTPYPNTFCHPYPNSYSNPRNRGYALHRDLYTFIETELRRINSRIIYDRQYYMDQIAGKYATCAYPNSYQTGNGMVDTDLNSQYGVIVEGRPKVSCDIEIISRTLKDIARWWFNRKSGHYDQIMKADKFGCSFHPECLRNTPEIVLTCAFHTTGYSSNPLKSTVQRISTTSSWYRRTTSTGVLLHLPAYAFTKELRKVAEGLFGQHWDFSYYLENLSGMVATCQMAIYHFVNVEKGIPSEAGVVDRFSYSGFSTGRTTEEDVEHIVKDSLLHFPLQVPARDHYKKFGCSILLNCYHNKKQLVVITCLFLRK